MAHDAFDLNKLAAGALKALGISADPSYLRDLPANVSKLLLAEVGLIVVLETHAAFQLRWESDASKSGACQ